MMSIYDVKYICTIYTRLDTCIMSISRLSLRDKVTLRVLKPYLINSGFGRVVSGAGHKAKLLVLQCINGVSSNSVEGRTKICQFKNLILKLFGLILFS